MKVRTETCSVCCCLLATLLLWFSVVSEQLLDDLPSNFVKTFTGHHTAAIFLRSGWKVKCGTAVFQIASHMNTGTLTNRYHFTPYRLNSTCKAMDSENPDRHQAIVQDKTYLMTH